MCGFLQSDTDVVTRVQAARKGDANKAAKSRQKQKELEAEAEAHMQYGAEVAALMAQGESSSDEEYDEDAIARDAAEAEYGVNCSCLSSVDQMNAII